MNCPICRCRSTTPDPCPSCLADVRDDERAVLSSLKLEDSRRGRKALGAAMAGTFSAEEMAQVEYLMLRNGVKP